MTPKEENEPYLTPYSEERGPGAEFVQASLSDPFTVSCLSLEGTGLETHLYSERDFML